MNRFGDILRSRADPRRHVIVKRFGDGARFDFEPYDTPHPADMSHFSKWDRSRTAVTPSERRWPPAELWHPYWSEIRKFLMPPDRSRARRQWQENHKNLPSEHVK